MFFIRDTLDDLMFDVLETLLKTPFDVSSTRGTSSEIIGAMLHLTNPRARLSRTETKGKPFSALGELMWYLSKDNNLEFITYYIKEYKKESEDGISIYGGYGPRIFNLRGGGIDQIDNIIKLLKLRPSSRKAVIQIFDGLDLVGNHPELPCTCTIQFIIRDGKLNLFTTMRSNDALIGLPHDIFTFTMLQEIIARSLNIEVGIYTHAVGSLHLYEDRKEEAKQYLSEGRQSTKQIMPEMPIGDPWSALNILSSAETTFRLGKNFIYKDIPLDAYWLDLIRLFRIFAYIKKSNYSAVEKIKPEMNFTVYNTYIDGKIKYIKNKAKKYD